MAGRIFARVEIKGECYAPSNRRISVARFVGTDKLALRVLTLTLGKNA